MFCPKGATRQIEYTQARAIRAINMDFVTPREDLLNVYSDTPIHVNNLKLLLIEVYKSLHKLNPEFMWDLFVHKQIVTNLRRGRLLALPTINEAGKNSLIYRAILAWNYLSGLLEASSYAV